jgi:RHS repeat-associated protein
VWGTSTSYGYDAENRRVMRSSEWGWGVPTAELYFYGVDGSRMGTYQVNLVGYSLTIQPAEVNLHFAGRLIKAGANWVGTDRLGSVVKSESERLRYFPWGEEQVTTTQNRDKFGTYYRDSTGLDYADQRYYSSQHGRFLTPDPYRASGGRAEPQSWNRYTYVENDPVNFADPRGLLRRCPAGTSSTGWSCVVDDVIGVEYEPTRYYYGPESMPGGGGRDAGGSRDTPAALEEWEALNTDCRSGLEAAMSVNADTGAEVAARLRLNALARAGGQTGVLAAAAAGSDPIDWTMLAAIGIRESGFADVLQKGGNGAGVFQIDLGKNSEVDVTDARNLAWAADWVANRLATNYAKLAAAYPDLDAAHLLQATAASYNFGLTNISGNPDTIDVGTPGNNYGSNIMNLMRCFR